MGFDLTMRETPQRIPAGFEPQYGDQPEYFRFNVWGMQAMRQIMLRAGLFDDEVDPEWPDFPPDGWEEDRGMQLVERLQSQRNGDVDDDDDLWSDVDPRPTDEEKIIVNAYLDACDEARAVRSPSTRRVPACKFASNDGWFVSPEECMIIARGLRAALDDRDAALWVGEDLEDHEARRLIEQWIAYNKLAAEYGGYRIY